MTMATLMLRVVHLGRLEATTRRAGSAAGFSWEQWRPGAWASFFGGWRRTGALTAAGVWLLAAVGALGQGSATVSLAWNPSPSPTVVGYNVYYGTASLAYTYEQSAGGATNATVSGLLPGTTYYFGVTALDAAGEESTFSNEVSYTAPGTAPSVPNPSNQGVTGNSPSNSSPSNSGLPLQPGTPGPGTGPIISSIADQVVDENSTLAPLPFTVTDAQFPPSSLSFSATSSNPVLVPAASIGFSGDGTDELVSVSPALGQVGSTSITLSVSDGTVSNSTTFVLTVTPPPGIALTSPQTGSGFVAPATITLAAEVASNGHTLSAVQFYSGATALGQASAPPYTLAWTGVSAGNYSLSASVTDELGSTVTSTPVLIAVSAPVVSSPPVVTLASPADGGVYLSPANLALSANVISNGHIINAVQYFNGSTALGTAVQPPYSLTWTDATPGSCTLSLQATYDTSFSVDSSAITIDVIGLPSPWLNTDIGSPKWAGAAGQTDGMYLVSGAGTIGGLSDSFQFAYQPMSGDVILYAYVSPVQDACANGLAGVMIRESLAPEAQYAAAGLTPDGGIVWSARTNTGSLALSYTWDASSLVPPATSNSGTVASPAPSMSGPSSTGWFCLMLVADTFFGFYSADGASWIAVGSTPSNMGPSWYCGLAVSSGAPNLLNTSSFANVNLSP